MNIDFNYHFYNRHNPALYDLLKRLHRHREELRKDIGQIYTQREGNISSIGSLQDEINRGILKDSKANAMAAGEKDQLVGFAEDDKVPVREEFMLHGPPDEKESYNLPALDLFLKLTKAGGYSDSSRFTAYKKKGEFIFDKDIIITINEEDETLVFTSPDGSWNGVKQPTPGFVRILIITRKNDFLQAYENGLFNLKDVDLFIQLMVSRGLWTDQNKAKYQKFILLNEIKAGKHSTNNPLAHVGDYTISEDEDYLLKRKQAYEKRRRDFDKKEKEFQGSGIKFVKNMNDMVDRLEILMGSRAAGNNSKAVFNEIVEILDVLKKQKNLTNAEYNQFYKALF